MRRIFLLLLWACSVLANQGSILQFIEQPKSVIANLGERIVLQCSANLPGVEVTWHFNDVILRPDTETKTERRKRNREDRETAHSSFNAYLDSQSSSGRSTSESGQNSVLPFSNRKKSRRRKGHQKNKHNEEEPQFGNRYVRSADGQKSASARTYGIQFRDGRLVIQSLSSENGGEYYCLVSNGQGTIRSVSATVQVAYIANFTYAAPATVVATSQATVLPCRFPKSVPPPSPRWRINGEVLEESVDGPYLVMRTGDLLIKNVTSSAGSKFRCGAFNSITGETKFASAATVLSVSGGTASDARSDRIYPTSDESVHVTVEVGKEVIMECVSGDLAQFVWTRDNGPVPDRAQITQIGLKITPIATDGGQYACKSPITGRSLLYDVIVSETPSIEMVTPIRETLQTDTDVIGIACGLKSEQMEDWKWKWYYNGEVIQDATDYEIRTGSKFGYYGGYYQCFAQNEFGTDQAVFFVDEGNPSSSASTLPTTVDYFAAVADPNAAIPEISRSQAAKQPTSHLLSWTMASSTEPELFSIKYYKEPYVDDEEQIVHYDSDVVNVRGDLLEVELTDLEPATTYVVEMIAISDAGTRSQVSISTFGTSQVVVTNPPDRRGVSKPRKEQGTTTDDRRSRKVKVPKSPSRPVVSDNSFHEVSLMWNSRGNGGSPIIGYKIQRKEMEGKDGWKTIGNLKTFPFRITNLERGKAYKFRVIAYNSAGDSNPSSPSKPYPKQVKQQQLVEAPKIVQANAQGLTSIVVMWKYENVPRSSIVGYRIFYRLTDSDYEEDYVKETLVSSTAEQYVIRNLLPEMQYDVKIQAYNDLGPSSFSNVMILEIPKSDGSVTISPQTVSISQKTVKPVDPRPDPSGPALDKAQERNTIFLITGGVFGAILLVLLVTVFCYWRRPAARNAQSTPEMKLKNGNASGCNQGSPTNNINMAKLNSNGHFTPSGSDSPHHHSNPSPHNTRCQCSRHHSNHSTLGRDASYPPYPVPPVPGWVPDPGWDPSSYLNIHSNPLHMYMDPRHSYFPARGIAGWVRNGEFCHIVPVDARKVNGDGGPEAVAGHYVHPVGHMVTRTYDGNLTAADDDSAQRRDHGYHSNEEGARTASDSQPDKSDGTNQDDDANSAGGATSGVVTLNDVTIESRPSSPSTREGDPLPEDSATNCLSEYKPAADVSPNGTDTAHEGDGARAQASPADENTPFLSEKSSTHNEAPVR